MYRLKLSKSVKYVKEHYQDMLDDAKRLNFDAIDLDLCEYWKQRDNEVEELKNLPNVLEAVKNSGVTLNAIHISFGEHWDFSSPTPEKRQEALDNFRALLPLTEKYSPFCYIIHGSWEPIEIEDRPKHIEALRDSLKQMASWTKTPIALENLPRTCMFNTSDEGLEIVEGIDGVYICCDVNHFLFENPVDAIYKLGSRIITSHISDYDFVNERHWLPGEGQIDWMKLIEAFEKVGFSGAFNYEVVRSFDDIKENFEMLFDKYNNK